MLEIIGFIFVFILWCICIIFLYINFTKLLTEYIVLYKKYKKLEIENKLLKEVIF